MKPKFKFFLVKDKKVLGCCNPDDSGYAVVECFPKDTNCYKSGGLKMRYEPRAGLHKDTIKAMIEKHGWKLENEMPFE